MMRNVACIVMQKDEIFLSRPWLAYHGHLFGFGNLFVLDNGSTDGPSAHLARLFLRGKEQYYASFLDQAHFYLPHFRALLRDLAASLERPVESVPEHLRLRVTEMDAAAKIEANGAVVIVPIPRDPDSRPNPPPPCFAPRAFTKGITSRPIPDSWKPASIRPFISVFTGSRRAGRCGRRRPPGTPIRPGPDDRGPHRRTGKAQWRHSGIFTLTPKRATAE